MLRALAGRSAPPERIGGRPVTVRQHAVVAGGGGSLVRLPRHGIDRGAAELQMELNADRPDKGVA